MKTQTTHARTASNAPSLNRLERSIAHQQERIGRGLRAGTLTADEGKKLQGKLDSLKSRIENDAFDGDGLSRGQNYQKALKGLSKDVTSQARNEQLDPARRMDHLDQRLANGLKDGSLTTQEHEALTKKAGELRKQLDAATTPEAKQALGKQLQALSREVHTERRDGELDSGKRQESFEKRIAAGLADGSLTQKEADSLRAQAKDVLATGSSNAQKNNALSKAIYSARHNNQMNAEVAVSSLKERIGALETGGKLTPDQASALKAELEKLSAPGVESQGARLNALRSRVNAFVQ